MLRFVGLVFCLSLVICTAIGQIPEDYSTSPVDEVEEAKVDVLLPEEAPEPFSIELGAFLNVSNFTQPNLQPLFANQGD